MSLVVVQTFSTKIEAEIAKGLLQSVGIFAVVQSDDRGGQHPNPPQGADLKVLQNDLEKAKKLLSSRPKNQ